MTYTLVVSIGRDLKPELQDKGPYIKCILDSQTWSNFKNDVEWVLDEYLDDFEISYVSRYSDVNTFNHEDEDSATFVYTIERDAYPANLSIIKHRLNAFKDRYLQESIFISYGESELI